jgi:tryptophan synthase beta chain
VDASGPPRGHGHFDLAAYQAYLAGELSDQDHPQQEIAMASAGLPGVG